MLAESLRFATWNVELSRKGPGLLLRDIERGDPQVDAVVAILASNAPDVLLLTDLDWDLDGLAVAALADRLAAMGHPMVYHHAPRPNSGLDSGLDLDGDGRIGRARDSHGFGYFTGDGGMALLSTLPILDQAAENFTAMLWRDLPGAAQPRVDDLPFPSAEAQAARRLSSVGHWVVPIQPPKGPPIRIAAFHATPPVFDGPEDLNGHRNHDEAALWLRWLDGSLTGTAPDGPLVILGDANLDPTDGAGRPEAMTALLAHPKLQDPEPRSDGGAATPQIGSNAQHRGDPALDTADWADEADAHRNAPGNLRVDYVLPSRGLAVLDAGVVWPAPNVPQALEQVETASRHRLIWVDVAWPP